MSRWSIIIIIVFIVIVGVGIWLYTPDKSRDELSPKYVRSAADFIEVAGVKLHIRDDGPRNVQSAHGAQNDDPPVVILLHGFGASLHTWEPWAASLAPTVRLIRFDLPGFGMTGADPTGDYSDERGFVIINQLMDKLGLARASIVGHSIGGRLAWRFAAAHPTRVDRLVLIAPDGFASPGFEYGKAAEVPAAMSLMRYSMPSFMVKMSLAPAYGDPKFMTGALLTRYRDMMLAPGVRGAMLERLSKAVLVPPEPLLKSIAAPTLVMWGEKDAMIPFANSADYMRLLSNATLVRYPALGHLPHEEAPAESVVAVQNFLMAR